MRFRVGLTQIVRRDPKILSKPTNAPEQRLTFGPGFCLRLNSQRRPLRLQMAQGIVPLHFTFGHERKRFAGQRSVTGTSSEIHSMYCRFGWGCGSAGVRKSTKRPESMPLPRGCAGRSSSRDLFDEVR